MGLKITQVDAFAERPFTGNPAAVCILDAPADAGWMQAVASEMNLSETAFLHPEQEGYRLRWFTPTVEVDLCGHATLASAHVLWEEGRLAPNEQARFWTRSGLLTADRRGDWIELDFPSTPVEPLADAAEIARGLGFTPRFIGRGRFDFLIECESEAAVRALKADLPCWSALEVRGYIVTSRAESTPADFVSRFFAPGSGIAEDPVTGSAHCALAPFWAERLGKTNLLGYQASARGGYVRVRLDDRRVHIGGQAVTVLRGELAAPVVAAASAAS